MVDWHSEAELIHDGFISLYLSHALIGLYFWEVVNTMGFEWELLSRRTKFRWPMIFYFAARYSMVAAMIGLLIGLDVNSRKLNCKALWEATDAFSQASVGFSSINLALRVIAIWNQTRYIAGLFGVLILGQWFLIFRSLPLTAVYVPDFGCAATSVSKTFIAASYVYTMVVDTTILVLSVYKLGVSLRERNPPLVKLLVRDGVVYFLIVVVFNVVSVTFILLDLNPVLRSMFGLPAGVVSVIASCRSVRRLHYYLSPPLDSTDSFRTSNPYVPGARWCRALPRIVTEPGAATTTTDHRIRFGSDAHRTPSTTEDDHGEAKEDEGVVYAAASLGFADAGGLEMGRLGRAAAAAV
ncbi:hypothetical protein PUNSTDRAFT_120595 [Punctularia strigosozonata HHB-11173 SS5]|uniref:uncharacterized protein n=1 Tax=Punctularia strigosozonata (strain HHB-11173) TaxID=741275 RepID=UPI0004417E66|nr:uncharacterized protein PUNSTDRAFT_120595 [Punctularia strigosozonata HHB-11173 SS5]EIN09346.1 hypothetical protein PUNSTDRAFT_120595 [Punctularia strigosozonata HHB-11173 SS5]